MIIDLGLLGSWRSHQTGHISAAVKRGMLERVSSGSTTPPPLTTPALECGTSNGSEYVVEDLAHHLHPLWHVQLGSTSMLGCLRNHKRLLLPCAGFPGDVSKLSADAQAMQLLCSNSLDFHTPLQEQSQSAAAPPRGRRDQAA